jgi:hypothetical protein
LREQREGIFEPVCRRGLYRLRLVHQFIEVIAPSFQANEVRRVAFLGSRLPVDNPDVSLYEPQECGTNAVHVLPTGVVVIRPEEDGPP